MIDGDIFSNFLERWSTTLCYAVEVIIPIAKITVRTETTDFKGNCLGRGRGSRGLWTRVRVVCHKVRRRATLSLFCNKFIPEITFSFKVLVWNRIFFDLLECERRALGIATALFLALVNRLAIQVL
jgi:hypothetical protein